MRTKRLRMAGMSACLVLLTCWNSAQAQTNLTGTWTGWMDQDYKIRGAGPDPDTFLGIPINDDARAAGLAYSSEAISEVDRQCDLWPQTYTVLSGFAITIWPSTRVDGSVVAWNVGGYTDRQPMTIWVDGRPDASENAVHTQGGFTTGRWMGATLVSTTTHSESNYMYRNGLPNSDQQKLTMFFTRHDDWMTVTSVVNDPAYLTFPYVLSTVYTTSSALPVRNADDRDATCTPEEEVPADSPSPTFLTTPEATLMFETKNYGIPHEAALGGAQTMYPEFARKIASQYKRPQVCAGYCCGGQDAAGKPVAHFSYWTKTLKCNATEP